MLCIGGAFDITGNKVTAVQDISGMYREEDFSRSKIDQYFKAYLALWDNADGEE